MQARAKFRDYDGRVRLVSKTGPSRAAAERALKQALTARRTPGGMAALTAGTRMTDADRRLAGGRPRLVDRHRAHLPLRGQRRRYARPSASCASARSPRA